MFDIDDEKFGMDACMRSVEFSVEYLHMNPFEELGRAIVRAKQDVFFNKLMIKAWEKYIEEHKIKWNSKEV